ncbi:MAG: isoprenylcysteine carboxylmethyltransferase family protein [bacterium]|nr:isoprenylcysteine carboxylmethyltransferase family protein [bacterium]
MSSRNRDAAAVRFPPPFLFLISIGLGVLGHRFVRPWPLPGLEGLTRTVIGLAVVSAGVGLAVVALGLFKRTGQEPEPWKSTPSIVNDGIYRYSRNPMYVALAVVQVGVGLGLGNLWIVASVALSLAAVYFVAVRPEETYLERKFGDEYRRYKARVRRWL